jgi:3-oxoacyl-[acyl-carrier protein] reductase
MVDLPVLDAADRRHRFDRCADHEARDGGALVLRPEAAAQRRANQRAQDVADVGAAAAFLASRQAAYITGSMLRIDGGLLRSV